MKQAIMFFALLILAMGLPSRGQTPNFVQSEVITDPDSLPSRSMSYSDGLGRQLQTSLFLEETKARSTATVYDDAGRPWKTTVPFNTSTMDYVADPLTTALSRGAVPFSETSYKPDPLNRPDAVGAPDNVTDADKTLTLSGSHYRKTWYLSTAFMEQNDNIDQNGLILDTYLVDAQLNNHERDNDLSVDHTHYLTVSKDPNGSFSQKVMDIFGNTITTCSKAGIRAEYFYDILGNLLRENPPHGNSNAPDRAVDATKATTYQYNTAGQLIAKTTPDAGLVEYVYNNAGQLIATQNARQHATTGDCDYTVYLYDALGRNYGVGINTTVTSFHATDLLTHSWVLNDAAPDNSKIDMRILKIYDDPANLAPYIGSTYTPDYLAAHFCSIDNCRGRLIAEIAYQSAPAIVDPETDPDGFFKNVTIDMYTYDEDGNVKAKIKRIPRMAEFAMFTYTHDQQGNNISYRYTKNDMGNDPKMDSLQYRLDRHNRLVMLHSTAPSATESHPIVGNYFDDYGRLWRKVVGYDVEHSTPASFSNYTYNMQNWMTSNYGARFSEMDICYNAKVGSTTATNPQYNGNISAVKYLYNLSTTPQNGTLQYTYDDVNRLTQVTTDDNTNSANESFAYNRDGTIRTKQRTSGPSGAVMFNGTYFYYPNSNKLLNVAGYPGKENVGNYIYDLNGNMVLDYSKKMYIEYDWRDMPTSFKFYRSIPLNVLSGNEAVARGALKTFVDANSANVVSEVKMTYDAGGDRVLKREYKYSN